MLVVFVNKRNLLVALLKQRHRFNDMTNDAERSPMSSNQPEFSKQYRNKNATRWSDESKNACLKVTSVVHAHTLHTFMYYRNACAINQLYAKIISK